MSKLQELKNKLCPNGVEFRKLGEIGKFYGGLNGKNKYDFINGNAKFISYKNVFNNIEIDLNINDTVIINENEVQNAIKYADVLFTGSSETLKETGMSSVVTSEPQENYYLNSFCFGLRFFDNIKILPQFSKYLFRSSNIRNKIIKCSQGVIRFNLSKKKMENIEIPIPPLEVQEEIVRILDTFTELIKELIKEHELRKKQYSYYRDKLLTFGEEVKRVKLGDIGKISMCKRIMKNETNPVLGIPFYKIGTFGGNPDSYISEELFEEYKSKYPYPKKGYILISTSGTIGKLVVFDGIPAYFQDSNIVWVDNNEEIVLNKFLYYIYQTAPWKITKGGTIARLYNGDIANTEIPLPPLDTQKRIVDILDKFDTYTNNLQEGLPAEIEKRKKQYEFYRDKLLTFKRK